MDITALSPASAETFTPEQAADRAAIIQTVDGVGFHADRNEWDAVAEQFHPEGAMLDYRSYQNAAAGTGETPAPQPPQSIVAAWQTVLPGYDHTQHVGSNHQVTLDGDQASVRSTIHAVHLLDGKSWTFLGDYEHELARTEVGWRITLMRAHLRGQLGDEGLPELAMARVAAGEAVPR